MSPRYSWIICLHGPHGFPDVEETIAIALNFVIPFDNAAYIATLSAHIVLGYAADSILQPNTISLFSDSNAQPTVKLLYFAWAWLWALTACLIKSNDSIFSFD